MFVIPGQRKALDPEPKHMDGPNLVASACGLWAKTVFMGPGFAVEPRPGMTHKAPSAHLMPPIW